MAVFLPLFLLQGCTAQAPEPEPVEVAAEPPAPPRIDPVVLHSLLDQADAAIAADHLTYPEEGSAYAIYRQILALEPGQEDAIRGLERLVELYVEMSTHALERGRYATARSMLARAKIILPDHPSIEPTEEQIRLLSQAQRTEMKLSQTDINSNKPRISGELAAFAASEAAQRCRYIISAKNDAQGRWIYQQLAGAADGYRLRAQIRIRLPAGVEKVCFPA